MNDTTISGKVILKAITKLVGTLALVGSRPVNVPEFCEEHGVTPVFFDTLRNMDGLVMDFGKPCTDGVIWFTKTAKLYELETDDVIQALGMTNSDPLKLAFFTKADNDPVAETESEPIVEPLVTEQAEPLPNPEQTKAALIGLKELADKLQQAATLCTNLMGVLHEIGDLI